MTIKQLNQIIEQGMALKNISQAYTEISSARLKLIRDQVQRNRFYLDDLSSLHQVVKQMAYQRGALPPKNNKSVVILLTSNYHFYGSVNSDLIKFFLSSQTPTDQIIVGKTAIEYLNGIKYQKKYAPFILKSDFPSLAELNVLVKSIKNYSQILVFYSRMKTVMVQVPTVSDITQTSYLKNAPPIQGKKSDLFIFEPELTKILDFFESQVTNLLLQQTFLDSELSRTASRLVSMDGAQSNADKYISEQKKLLNNAKKTISNARLIEVAITVNLLKKKGELIGRGS